MPETTGSGRARGKRPGMEINFYAHQKTAFFSWRKMAFLSYAPTLNIFGEI
ncbi:hypothetical protein ACH0B6_12500 [Solibacillus silvestris]